MLEIADCQQPLAGSLPATASAAYTVAVLADIAGEMLGGIFRFIGRLLFEAMVGFLIQGAGHMIPRTVRLKSEPDDTASTFVGLAFWAAVIVDAALADYGPSNRDGAFSSDSNREFETWLKARDPRSGIRDFEAVNALAETIGLRLVADIAMPANNRPLIWWRSAPS